MTVPQNWFRRTGEDDTWVPVLSTFAAPPPDVEDPQPEPDPPPSGEVTHGVQLTTSMVGPYDETVLVGAGQLQSSFDGQIIENRDIVFSSSTSAPALHIRHSGVIVRNCRIFAGGPAAGITIDSSAANVRVEWCSFDGGSPSYGTSRSDGNWGNIGVLGWGPSATIRRCLFTGFRVMTQLRRHGYQFVENWLDTPWVNVGGVSTSAVSYRGSTLTAPPTTRIERCRVVSGTSGGLLMYPVDGMIRKVNMLDNLVVGVGRGFGILGGRDNIDSNRNWCLNRDIRIEGNRFDGQFGFPNVLAEGTNAAVDVTVPGHTWITNRWVGSSTNLPARCGKTQDSCQDLGACP